MPAGDAIGGWCISVSANSVRNAIRWRACLVSQGVLLAGLPLHVAVAVVGAAGGNWGGPVTPAACEQVPQPGGGGGVPVSSITCVFQCPSNRMQMANWPGIKQIHSLPYASRVLGLSSERPQVL
jgi:hypothetical protein